VKKKQFSSEINYIKQKKNVIFSAGVDPENQRGNGGVHGQKTVFKAYSRQYNPCFVRFC
jgi:hypothetical protein